MTAPLPSSDDVPIIEARDWAAALAKYRQPSTVRSLFELTLTLGLLLVLLAAAFWSMRVSTTLTVVFSILASAPLVRLFMIQHDCSHGAFFKSKRANNWTGRIIGVLTLTPYDVWKQSHLIHHSTHGNLDRRGIGDITTLTVEEYNSRTFVGRLAYRLYRHPLILFGVGPVFIFLFHHRLPIGFLKGGAKYWVSAMGTNITIVALLIFGGVTIGWGHVLLVFLLVTMPAAVMGVWLFYVQHQFEHTVWDPNETWQLHTAALYGSSYYALPQPLRWMTANIGIHHVHHLNSRVPFYRLQQVLSDHPKLASIGRMTLLDSFKTTKLKLWDPVARRLVPFDGTRRTQDANHIAMIE